MPGWSPEIANEFIRLAAKHGRKLDQLQLQALIYIAHGWCLAIHGQPLTGDRPEASKFGPVYRRLADALAKYGRQPISQQITMSEPLPNVDRSNGLDSNASDLDISERDLIREIFEHYGAFESPQLSALTRKGNAPWKAVFADGAGLARDISHNLVRAQFVEFLRQSEN